MLTMESTGRPADGGRAVVPDLSALSRSYPPHPYLPLYGVIEIEVNIHVSDNFTLLVKCCRFSYLPPNIIPMWAM